MNNGAVPDEEFEGAIYLGEETGWRHLAKTSTWNQVPGTSWRHKTATWNFLPQELLELPAQSVLPGVSPGASCKKLSGCFHSVIINNINILPYLINQLGIKWTLSRRSDLATNS